MTLLLLLLLSLFIYLFIFNIGCKGMDFVTDGNDRVGR